MQKEKKKVRERRTVKKNKTLNNMSLQICDFGKKKQKREEEREIETTKKKKKKVREFSYAFDKWIV